MVLSGRSGAYPDRSSPVIQLISYISFLKNGYKNTTNHND
nr:MAG TPA: hypothetical protein [Caudoviricetes sp.]